MIRRADLAALKLFARGSAAWVQSGHAAGQVVEVYDGKVVVDFGEALAWFREDVFTGVSGVSRGDFVTVGPAVPRWGVIAREGS